MSDPTPQTTAQDAGVTPQESGDSAADTAYTLEVARDGWTKELQLSVNERRAGGGGSGYRVAGAKFNGSSTVLLEHQPTPRDIAEIRAWIDRAEAAQSPAAGTAVDRIADTSAGPVKDGQFLVGYSRLVTRQGYLELTDALGFGDDVTEPAPTPAEMLDQIRAWRDAEHDHFDCPAWCEECDQWEQPMSCEPCGGSGTSPLDEPEMDVPCEHCGGEGRDHRPHTPSGTWRHQPLADGPAGEGETAGADGAEGAGAS